MEASDSISIFYNLDLDDKSWRHTAIQALRQYNNEGRKVEALRAHVAAAAKLRQAIRRHEHCIQSTYPMIPHRHPTTPRQALRYIIAGIEYAYQGTQHLTSNNEEIWSKLYAGAWSIIDYYEQHGRRYLFIYNTDAGELDPLRLTPLQRGTLCCLSRGLGDAEIAATLGTKLDAASALVRTVKKKLRIPIRRELIGLNEQCLRTLSLETHGLECALLYSSTALAAVIPDSISDAERDILQLQIAGKNNNEIAQIRRVAYKTVSNQVATAYSKLNVRTCGEMLHNLRVASR